jgi:hypothetical protein
MEDVVVYLMAIWFILRQFCIFCGHLPSTISTFFRFGMLHQEKSGNPVGELLETNDTCDS